LLQAILLKFAIIFAALVAIISAWRIFLAWQRIRFQRKQKNVLLQIRVSRVNEKLPIVAEQIFAVLHGISRKISFWEKLCGVTIESFSFEIANVSNQIKFFAHAPAHLKNFLENQIYAQYPDIEIEEIPDYLKTLPVEVQINKEANKEKQPSPLDKTLTKPEQDIAPQAKFQKINEIKNALAAEITFTDPVIYPIKRHAQFEDKITRTLADPLSGITSALMKLSHVSDLAAVQIVVRPLDEWWRIRATKCARVVGKNIFFGIEKLQKIYVHAFMTRKIWPKIIFFPFYFIFFFQGLMAGSRVKFSQPNSPGTNATDDEVLEVTSSRQHERETEDDAVMDKVTKLPFDCSLRVLYVSATADKIAKKVKVRELAGSFKQFNQPHLNGFEIAKIDNKEIVKQFYERKIYNPIVLNNEELATIFHLPNMEVKTPNIFWVNSKKLEPPIDLPNPQKQDDLTILGKTNFRGSEQLFGINQEDRRRHVYIIGKTGMGKSTLLENMVLSDIQAGRGVAVVDPHGDLADHIIDRIPANRTNDVIVFDPSDRDFPVAFNMLENIDSAMNSVVTSGLVGIFKKLYADSWGPRLEHILRNTIISLLEYPNTTMLGIPRILADTAFRKRVVHKITDPVVKKFWADEFDAMHERQRVEAISPIQNKVGQFLSSPIIRNIVGQPKSMINLRFAMDHKKIFICNLSKGKIGEDNSSLLGSMIITKFQLDAMSRSNIPEKDRVDFYLYVDEFQNFATDSFATILSEARKYRLNLTMANQYIAQMSDEVRDAVFGNVGTLESFQVGFDDAEYISKQFSEVAMPEDLVQLPKYNLYNKLLIDGMPSQPFSAATLPPISEGTEEGRKEKVIRFSRERFAKPREMVEDKIMRWSLVDDDAKDDKQKKLPIKKTKSNKKQVTDQQKKPSKPTKKFEPKKSITKKAMPDKNFNNQKNLKKM
jgi:hypothetical protein